MKFRADYIQKTADRLHMTVEEVRSALPQGNALVEKIDRNIGTEFAFSDEELRLLHIALTYYLFDPSRADEELRRLEDLG